jgi:hypothetical protein
MKATFRTALSCQKRANSRTFMSLINHKSMSNNVVCQKIFGDNAQRYLSTETKDDDRTPIILYEGAYSSKLRLLRMVSFGSSIFCTVGLPLGLAFTGMAGSVPFVGQVLIASTAIVISLSSTAFLQVVTHPYTVVLKEIPQKLKEGEVLDVKNRVFRATRINVYGKYVETEFTLKEAERIKTSSHPFASVKIKGMYFYIFGRHMPDIVLRHGLTNEE